MKRGLEAELKGRRGRLDLDVTIAAPAGHVTVLGGASGSGKTTILRALAGLERLDGQVRVGGATWQDARRFEPAFRRRVGYVFQQGALFPHLSVSGNLDYARRRSGADQTKREHAVATLDLQPLLGRMPDRLSGGERARVALARAFLTAPALMLLDEPLTGLDRPARDALLPVLRQALLAFDTPVLLVTHDVAEARALGDRLIRLEGGRAAEAPLHDDAVSGLSGETVNGLARAALAAGLPPQL